jgi:pimeloyl-ACP methyl ester carboxylesterase
MREAQIDLGDVSLHLAESGPDDAPALLCLHGWPQDHHAFDGVRAMLEDRFRVVAVDLPGIGRSVGAPRGADKRALAGHIDALIKAVPLRDLTLVGHDVGGQIAYAYLRAYPNGVARAAILNVAIPGVPPWADVIRDPRIWHFAFHAVPDLPERLVAGRERAYFDFFFDGIAAQPGAISDAARRRYVQAYAARHSLSAGFDWYRAFPQDARDNAALAGTAVETRVLYVRGQREGGELEAYVDGLRGAGLSHVEGALIPECGHFSPEEQPSALAEALEAFVRGGSP